MNKTLFLSIRHLLICGPNASFGNHVLHMLYSWNLAKSQNFNFKIPVNSNLDLLFDLDEYKEKLNPNASCFFAEEYGGDILEYQAKEKRNLDTSLKLLRGEIGIPLDAFWVEGCFQHYQTSPKEEIFRELKIKPKVLQQIKMLYPYIAEKDCISLHYRGTDFRNVSHGWGDCRVSLDYYKKCLEHVSEYHKHITKINVFTDEKSFINDLSKLNLPFKINPISNSFYVDWCCLLLSKNFISSNSSFAFSAGLYNKDILYQPRNFLLREHKVNVCFPVDAYCKGSIII